MWKVIGSTYLSVAEQSCVYACVSLRARLCVRVSACASLRARPCVRASACAALRGWVSA